MALVSLLALLLAVVAAAATGWRRERQLRVWDDLLGPAAHHELNAETRATRRQLDTIDDTYRLAHHRRRTGQSGEAQRLLEVAYRTVQAFVPGRIERLHTMIRMSRAVSAMLPVRQPWRSLRTARLALLATVHRTLRVFLVTTGERFRLRVRLLVRAFTILVSRLGRYTDRAPRTPTSSWVEIDDLRADLESLNNETLACYQVVLASLEREHRLDHVPSPAA